jgi:hypothetical protein
MADERKNSETSADLLGYHLGLLDDEARARVEVEFSPETLAAWQRNIDRLLRPLQADAVGPAPTDLVDGVLRRVKSLHRTLPFEQARPVVAAEPDRGGGAKPMMTMRELVGLAAAIALFVGIFVPGYRTARMASQQAVCANNLRLIGNGYAAYADTYGGQWPYAGPVPVGASWRTTPEPGVPQVSNSRHVFRLVSGRYVAPGVFVCPARCGDRIPEGQTFKGLETFPDPHNNSYATNLITSPWRQNEFEATMPVAADMNPLAEEARAVINARDLPPNSRSHGRSGGQNVLHANISVRFYRNPNVGVENDDIYRLIGVQEYTGRERPTLRSDAFLIP